MESGDPDYPPVMGEINATLAGEAITWQTYDFSIGAFDASAWATPEGGQTVLHLMGYAPGKPDDLTERVSIIARFDGPAVSGATPATVMAEILQTEDWEGARLTSAGKTALFVLDRIDRQGDESYGHASGHFEATLCFALTEDAPVDDQQCSVLLGAFDTEVQFENM